MSQGRRGERHSHQAATAHARPQHRRARAGDHGDVSPRYGSRDAGRAVRARRDRAPTRGEQAPSPGASPSAAGRAGVPARRCPRAESPPGSRALRSAPTVPKAYAVIGAVRSVGGRGRRDEPHEPVPRRARAPAQITARDGHDREPGADGPHRPRSTSRTASTRERDGPPGGDQRVAARGRTPRHREHDGGARRRRGEAEQPQIAKQREELDAEARAEGRRSRPQAAARATRPRTRRGVPR